MPTIAQIISRRARKYGVDPRAALAVARGEGGLRRGAVGDSGTSFGPFQLHRGGAMPAGRSAAWASSPAGIDYALRKMAQSGARGLTGPAAVEAIIRRFERPADPDSSVSNALGRYGQGGGFSEQPYTGGGGGIGEMPDFAGSLRKSGVGELGGQSSELPDFAGGLGKKKKAGAAIPGFDLDAAPTLTPPPQLQARGGGGSYPASPLQYQGKKMILPTSWKSTHPTDGLADQGFTHAEDIMGNPGTPVGAPESGTIVRHGSAQGGSSIYFRADSGRMYWIGHIESNVPVGTRVKRGQVIAAISADHPRPHVHLDYSTSY